MPVSSSEAQGAENRLIPRPLPGDKLPRGLSLEIRLTACLIPALNYFLSPQQVARLLQPRRRFPSPGENYPRDLARYIGLLLHHQAFLGRRICISRSYLLYRFLRRFGYPAILNFGLMGDNRKEGHCWITLNGKVFFDETEPDKEFAILVGVEGQVVYWI